MIPSETQQRELVQCLMTLNVPEDVAKDIAEFVKARKPETIWHFARRQFQAEASKICYIPDDAVRKECLDILRRSIEGVRAWLETFSYLPENYHNKDRSRRLTDHQKDLIRLFWDAGVGSQRFLGKIFFIDRESVRWHVKQAD